MKRPTILLNPGPVTLSERVRRALTREDMCHREPDFAALMLDIKRRLAQVYPAASDVFDAIPLTGSGTGAVEAMLSTFAPKNAKTLVLANGVYGERMAAMLHTHGKPFELLRAEWPQAIDLAATEQRLARDTGISHVVTVHNETTTGRLNDIDPLLALCKKYDKALMLDAVSSFGAEAIDFAHPNLLAVAATGNKCLHGIVGIAFVLARHTAFQGTLSQSNSVYLDLHAYHAAQRDGYSPFTQAVHACFALDEALKELADQGGWQARRERYRMLAKQIRAGLKALNVNLFLPETAYSSMISSFHLPSGWTYERLHDRLRAAGFVIYAGQGGLAHSLFRVCNMGDIWDEDIERLLATFHEALG